MNIAQIALAQEAASLLAQTIAMLEAHSGSMINHAQADTKAAKFTIRANSSITRLMEASIPGHLFADVVIRTAVCCLNTLKKLDVDCATEARRVDHFCKRFMLKPDMVVFVDDDFINLAPIEDDDA